LYQQEAQVIAYLDITKAGGAPVGMRCSGLKRKGRSGARKLRNNKLYQ